MATKREVKGFLIGTAAGAAIGAVTALLLAPKAGKELRQDIAEGAQHIREKTVKAAERVGGKAAELFDAAAVWRRNKPDGEAEEAVVSGVQAESLGDGTEQPEEN